MGSGPAYSAAGAIAVRAAALACALGLACALPLLAHGGPSCGHDFDFHLQSWLAVAGAWRHGWADPHWAAAANYGAGEPRFVFYPPFSWLLGALLGMILPWGWVPWAFTAVCVAGAAGAMFRIARRFCPPTQAGLAASLYAAGPYLLFTAYERTAYGELLAAVWMPLLLGLLSAPRLPVTGTAVWLAALWYSDPPAGVMGCYLIVFALFWRVFADARAWRRQAVRHAAALVLGCLLAADYLVPAWYEQRWVAIGRAVGPGMRIRDSFLFGHTGEPFHDAVLHTASWIAVWTLGAGAVAGAVALRRKCGDPVATARKRAAGFCVVLLAACFLLQLPFSGPVWDVLPELGFLQFPWRLLLPASAAVALLAAFGATGARFGHGRVRRPIFMDARWLCAGAGLLFVAVLVGWAGATRYQPCDDEDNVPAQIALLHSGTGFEGTDEYAAADTDNGEIQQGLPAVRLLRSPEADEGDDSSAPNPAWAPGASAPGTVKVKRWSPESIAIQVRPGAPAFAVLRLERFPAWRVRVDGAPCGARCRARDDGLLTVAAPEGRWSVIDVEWRTTPDVWWARALSGCGILALLFPARKRFAGMMGRK